MRWYSLSRRSTSSDQKAPPLAGELSVSDSEQTEGEQLTALGSFEPFPFRHGSRRDTFPARGDSFWVALPPACHERGGGFRVAKAGGVINQLTSLRLFQPLRQSALRRIASSPAGEPFGLMQQKTRPSARRGEVHFRVYVPIGLITREPS